MGPGAKAPAAPAAGNEVTTAEMLRHTTPGVSTKLTVAQRRQVRELIEDSGYTRAEAVAWVKSFGGDS